MLVQHLTGWATTQLQPLRNDMEVIGRIMKKGIKSSIGYYSAKLQWRKYWQLVHVLRSKRYLLILPVSTLRRNWRQKNQITGLFMGSDKPLLLYPLIWKTGQSIGWPVFTKRRFEFTASKQFDNILSRTSGIHIGEISHVTRIYSHKPVGLKILTCYQFWHFIPQMIINLSG